MTQGQKWKQWKKVKQKICKSNAEIDRDTKNFQSFNIHLNDKK